MPGEHRRDETTLMPATVRRTSVSAVRMPLAKPCMTSQPLLTGMTRQRDGGYMLLDPVADSADPPFDVVPRGLQAFEETVDYAGAGVVTGLTLLYADDAIGSPRNQPTAITLPRNRRRSGRTAYPSRQ